MDRGPACHFAPGQRVVCIYGGPWFDVNSPNVDYMRGPEKDVVYHVLAVLKDDTGEVYLHLDGWPYTYHHANFRPLRETSIDVFTALLNKTPTSEPITRREREEVR